MRRKSRHRKILKTTEKIHNEIVDQIAERPEILGINGLSLETLLHDPIKFPELKSKGRETIDLIFIWSPCLNEWEILLLEEKVGYRHDKNGLYQLKIAFEQLSKHWRKWFRGIGLELPKGYTLWIRRVFLGYQGLYPLEQPFKKEKRARIR